MIKSIKKSIPQNIKDFYRLKRLKYNLFKDYIYDYRRFLKFSATKGLIEKESIRAYMIKEYHAIEKGLTLRNTRPGFGVKRILKLVKVMEKYTQTNGKDWVTNACFHCLLEYLEFHKGVNLEDENIINRINEFVLRYGNDEADIVGGTRHVKKQEILSMIDFDYSSFVKSRFSTRDFTDDPVNTETLLKAIDCARYTPSVCNRQGWKVYVIESSNKELIEKFLSVQNGNRGFSEQVQALLIVTGKLSSFFPRERNQAFIDGGMFAMSIVLSLHAHGLGACCLNTSYTSVENIKFNKVMKLDHDIVPIMFIAVGNLKEEYKVALSNRKTLGEISQIL